MKASNLKIAHRRLFSHFYDALAELSPTLKTKLDHPKFSQDGLLLADSWVLIDELIAVLQELTREKRLDILIKASQEFDISQISEELIEENRPPTLGQALNILLSKISHITSQAKAWLSYGEDGRWYLCHDSGYSNLSVGKAEFDIYRNLLLISFCQLYLGEEWQPEFVWVTAKTETSLAQSKLSIEVIGQHQFSGFAIPLSEKIENPSGIKDWSLSESVSLVLDNYVVVENMTTHSFAKLVGMSVRTLQRRLHDEQVTFRDLLLDSRLGYAIKTFKNDNRLQVEEIAARCGYSDVANFRRAFKKRYNMTFNQYMNKML
ncbi:helix-turn-helix domain-containing protein [Vibrio campbellii]